MHRMILRALAVLLTLTAVVGGTTIPAWAGEDRGMCKADNSRVRIPSSFPIKACFDGKTLYLLNDASMPVAVTVTGDETSSARRYAQGGADGAARLLDFIQPSSFGTHHPAINAPKFRNGHLPPDHYLSVAVGNSEVTVKLSSPDGWTQKAYVIAEAIWRYTPLQGGAEIVKALGDLVNEVMKVGDEYIRCMDRNNAWGDIHCVLLVERNVAFAVGRAAVNIAWKGGVATVVKMVLGLFDAAKWKGAISGTQGVLRGGDRNFTISAYTPPKPGPEPKPEPKPEPERPPANQGGGSGNQGGNEPPKQPQPDPPQEPQPQPRTATATVQNMHLEGASGLGEDSTPSYLSTVMQPRCAANGCKIGGTDMWSGATFTALCWDTGAWMTNENRNIPGDDGNPHRVDTDRWLKGQRAGQVGYISYIYVTPQSRQLPIDHC